MRNVFYVMAVAGLLAFSACEAKKPEETTTTVGPSTNATDIAETTAVPVDTTGLMLNDSMATDSVNTQ